MLAIKMFCTAGLASIALLSGCAFTGQGLDPGPAGAHRLGTERAEGKPSDYPVKLSDLIRLAVDGSAAPFQPIVLKAAVPASAAAGEDDPADSLEQARKYFYDNCHADETCGALRDRVQDRLIWASESACSDYLTSVRKSFTATNLNLGSATTLFGALGSVVTSMDVTRVFSGAAAVSSGLRAEYNDVYFASQAFELVSKAIRAVRERSLRQIREARADKGIRAYTLDGAVADAMRYHATCGVMAGLEEAAEAVTRERDPGLKHVNELLLGVGGGMNLALGTLAIDVGVPPSAVQSCRAVSAFVRTGTEEKSAFDAKALKVADDAAASVAAKATMKDRQGKVQASFDLLNKADENAKGSCLPLKESAADKAEVAMFEAMRAFAALPPAERALGKSTVEKERQAVLMLKAEIQKSVDAARVAVDGILATTRLPSP